MPCVSATGELTPSGRSILECLLAPADAETVSMATGLPVYRARAALREFVGAGLAEQRDTVFAVTPTGLERLREAEMQIVR